MVKLFGHVTVEKSVNELAYELLDDNTQSIPS